MSNRNLLNSPEQLTAFCRNHPTPFYLYHEDGMRARCRELFKAFGWSQGFQQFFAVKATPNPHIVSILAQEGCGTDCSSPAELFLSEKLNIRGSSVIFTSNNTTVDEFSQALSLDAIINLDVPDHIDKLLELPHMPRHAGFRYNPGREAVGNVIIGSPEESKFGCTKEQLLGGYRRASSLGIESLGLHTMIVSNELSKKNLISNAEMLFRLAVQIEKDANVRLSFINLGGGIGIPYAPGDIAVDLETLGLEVRRMYQDILVANGMDGVRIMTENGRAITGPFGYLVSRVINKKTTFKNYLGIDACMSNLMRPGMYGAYHRISVVGREETGPKVITDVVGSLCENNDKFAVDRELPEAHVGDLVVIHDVGAHGHCMGFQYNGRLRSAEYLFSDNGDVRRIRRAETLDDYFATVEFPDPPATNGAFEKRVDRDRVVTESGHA